MGDDRAGILAKGPRLCGRPPGVRQGPLKATGGHRVRGPCPFFFSRTFGAWLSTALAQSHCGNRNVPRRGHTLGERPPPGTISNPKHDEAQSLFGGHLLIHRMLYRPRGRGACLREAMGPRGETVVRDGFRDAAQGQGDYQPGPYPEIPRFGVIRFDVT